MGTLSPLIFDEGDRFAARKRSDPPLSSIHVSMESRFAVGTLVGSSKMTFTGSSGGRTGAAEGLVYTGSSYCPGMSSGCMTLSDDVWLSEGLALSRGTVPPLRFGAAAEGRSGALRGTFG